MICHVWSDVQTAVVAKEALEGHCIYDGGFCKLHISYSRHTDLSIKVIETSPFWWAGQEQLESKCLFTEDNCFCFISIVMLFFSVFFYLGFFFFVLISISLLWSKQMWTLIFSSISAEVIFYYIILGFQLYGYIDKISILAYLCK